MALHGPGPWPRDGHPLPDESSSKNTFLNSTVLDGVHTHHFGSDNESPPVTSLVDDISGIVAAPDTPAMTALHDRLARSRALDVADDLVRELRARDLPTEELRHLARALAEHGTRRNAVAVGIVILGVVGDHRDRELLLLLGHLDDLTLYAAVALAKTQPDRDQALYQLAQSVNGWGRIHAVERLAGTQDPEIKAWLLRDGFRNGVLYDYLAHIAATTGGLYAALLESDIDAELLDGAAEILDTLVCWGGPAADIRHYPDALPVVDRFGEVLESAPPTLARIAAVHRLKRLLTKELPPELDWPPAEVSRQFERYSALLVRPEWSEHVRSVLGAPDSELEFNRALGCAETVGVDAYARAMARIQRPPLSPYVWAWLARHTPDSDLAELARMAVRLLPLDELACGPDPDCAPLGRSEERILETVLSRLGPTAAELARPLIHTAIRAKGTRMRRIGLEAVDRVFGPDLPADIRDWVSEAAIVEPHDEIRGKLMKLLERAPLDLDE